MGKLLLTLMLVLASTGALAEWTEVGRNHSSGMTQYADSATIQKTGKMVKMWDLIDYKSVVVFSGNRFISGKRQQEYDCEENKIRVLAYTQFIEHMGNGKVVFSSNDPNKWESVVPESMGEALWKIACGKR